MKSTSFLVPLLLFTTPAAASAQVTYSTGSVSNYNANCGLQPDLPWSNVAAEDFRCWYDGEPFCFGPEGFDFGSSPWNNFTLVTRWEDADVWGTDFRDGSGTNDTDPSGGSDLPSIYLYVGHGTCQSAPQPTDPDFITVCTFGAPDFVDIGASSQWGTGTGGKQQFLFLDASCPMDFVSLPQNWFWVQNGMHVATGHSGDATHDTLNSPWRPSEFGAYTSGNSSLVPQLSVGDAWMATGLIDVQPGTCAAMIAAGETEADALDRRDNERVTDGRVDPIPNWVAWTGICY